MQLPALCSPQPPNFPISWGFPSSSTQHKPPPRSVLRTPSSTAPLPRAELALGHIILRAPPRRPSDSVWQGETIPHPSPRLQEPLHGSPTLVGCGRGLGHTDGNGWRWAHEGSLNKGDGLMKGAGHAVGMRWVTRVDGWARRRKRFLTS